MALEIERKFLVKGDAWKACVVRNLRFRQGYLTHANGKNSVRVRMSGDHAHINLKGSTLGVERLEFEYPVPLKDAGEILEQLVEGPLIEKTRYFVEYSGHTWEIDVFEGDNAGLIVAEIELQAADEHFEPPEWIGMEVTDDKRYYNACLVKKPFSGW